MPCRRPDQLPTLLSHAIAICAAPNISACLAISCLAFSDLSCGIQKRSIHKYWHGKKFNQQFLNLKYGILRHSLIHTGYRNVGTRYTPSTPSMTNYDIFRYFWEVMNYYSLSSFNVPEVVWQSRLLLRGSQGHASMTPPTGLDPS